MSIRMHYFLENIGGLNLHTSIGGLNDNEAEEIVNMHVTGRGSWSSQNTGYTTLTGTVLNSGAQITGMYQYSEAGGTEHTVVAAGSNIYEFNLGAGTGTSIGSGFTPDVRVNFTTFQNLMILCNGRETPKKWTGSGNLTDLTGWPPSIAGVTTGYPSLSAVFANRLVFSGDSLNPSMVFISALEDPQMYTPGGGSTSAGALQVAPGDGDRITGLKTLYLPIDNEEVLVIFKERSIYLLTGHDADTFALQKLTSAIGASSHQGIVLLGNDLYFLSSEGISTLSTATLQGNLAAGSISQKVTSQIANLNRSALSGSFAVHLPNRQEIWWFVPDGSSTQNQLVLVFNYGLGQGVWSRRVGITAASAVVVNRLLYTGTYTGHVQRQLYGNSYAGSAITWQYRTPFYALGQPRFRKRVRELELFLTQLSGTTFTVKASWDNVRSDARKQSRNVSVQLTNQSYGAAVYGADKYEAAGISRRKLVLNGSGECLQLEFTGTQTASPVEIQGWSIATIEGGF
jgi:hypothetical protein